MFFVQYGGSYGVTRIFRQSWIISSKKIEGEIRSGYKGEKGNKIK